MGQYFTKGKGPLTSLGGVEGLAFVHTKYSNSSSDWPDIEIHFSAGNVFADGGKSLVKLAGLAPEIWDTVYKPFEKLDSFSLLPVLLRPKSRGTIRLRSPNPYVPPIIDPRYLTHPDDVTTLVEGMKICLNLGHSPPYTLFGSTILGVPFPGCQLYPWLSDSYLACLARLLTLTIYHPGYL